MSGLLLCEELQIKNLYEELDGKKRYTQKDVDRFLSKLVTSTTNFYEKDGTFCIEFTSKEKGRYKHFSFFNQNTAKWDGDLAHRFAYEIFYGLIPDDKIVHHKCHNRSCCKHLKLLTQIENVQESGHYQASKRTHCKSGLHEWIPENIRTQVINGMNSPICKMCDRISHLKYYHEHKEKINQATKLRLLKKNVKSK